MNLNKFLRKNSRVLLMVFMSFLLVAFLVPSQIQGCGEGRSGDSKLGTAFGRDIHTSDLNRARVHNIAVQTLGLLPPEMRIDPLVYHLLVAEAHHAGVHMDSGQAKERLRARNTGDAALRIVQRDTGLSYDGIYAAVADWLSVEALLETQASVLCDTLPREEQAYRDRNQQADAFLSLLDARAFNTQVPAPTEEQLGAFFDKYKDQTRATSESELSYGYRRPDRVRIEWLTIDPARILPTVVVKGSQVRTFFDENKRRYTKPDPSASQPVAGRPPPQVPMTFEEAESRAREDCRMQRAIEEAQRLMNEIADGLSQPWRNAAFDTDGFRTPPASAPESLADVVAKYAGRQPVDFGTSPLADADLLDTITSIGNASATLGRQRMTTSQLAFRVKGLLPKDPGDGLTVLNLTEPSPILIAPDAAGRYPSYQAFVFRVTEVVPSAPPESLEVVRSAVEDDWRETQVFDMAKQQAEQVATRAREVGLTQAVAEATALREQLTAAATAAAQPTTDTAVPPPAPRYVEDLEPFAPEGLTRIAQFVRPRVGRTATVPEAIFKLADEPTVAGQKRVATIPLADQLKWVIAEVIDLRPLYQGDFEMQLASMSGGMRRNLMQGFFGLWLSPEQVEQRTGFVSVLPPEAQQAPPGEVEE